MIKFKIPQAMLLCISLFIGCSRETQTKDGKVPEVISDLQSDVQVFDCESEGYTCLPSRPLWDYVRKATKALFSR